MNCYGLDRNAFVSMMLIRSMNNIYVYYTLFNLEKIWAGVQEGLSSSFQACVWVLSDFMLPTVWEPSGSIRPVPNLSHPLTVIFLNYEG